MNLIFPNRSNDYLRSLIILGLLAITIFVGTWSYKNLPQLVEHKKEFITYENSLISISDNSLSFINLKTGNENFSYTLPDDYIINGQPFLENYDLSNKSTGVNVIIPVILNYNNSTHSYPEEAKDNLFCINLSTGNTYISTTDEIPSKEMTNVVSYRDGEYEIKKYCSGDTDNCTRTDKHYHIDHGYETSWDYTLEEGYIKQQIQYGHSFFVLSTTNDFYFIAEDEISKAYRNSNEILLICNKDNKLFKVDNSGCIDTMHIATRELLSSNSIWSDIKQGILTDDKIYLFDRYNVLYEFNTITLEFENAYTFNNNSLTIHKYKYNNIDLAEKTYYQTNYTPLVVPKMEYARKINETPTK